jgi:hypothetical protein
MLAAGALAAPVSLPPSSKPVEGEMWTHREDRLEFSLGVEADYLSLRELDEADAQISGGFYGAKCDFSLSASKQQAFDFTLSVGKAYGFKVEAAIGNNVVDFEIDDEVYLGAGVVHAFTLESHKIQMMANLAYRHLDAEDSGVEISLAEWHAAFVIAKRFDRAVPYAGLRYSDVTVDAEATVGANVYELDSAKSDTNVGIVAGVSLTLGRAVSLDIEARFGDETAFSAGFSYTF